jgi:putative MATE family efflux protein
MKLGIPILVGNCVAFLYTVVDTLFISLINRGSTALVSGTGIIVPVYFLFFSLGSGVSVGVASLVARGIGAADPSSPRSTVASGMLLASAISLFSLVAGFSFINDIVRLLAGSRMGEEAIQYGIVYFRTTLPGLALLLLGQVYLGVLQGEGKTRPIAAATVISTAANIALAPLLIFTFRMGVAGAGLATSLSIALAAVYVVVVFARGGSSVPLFPGLGNARLRMVLDIARVGFPQTLGMLALSLVALLLNKIVGSVGQAQMDSWSLVGRIDQMVSVPVLALAAATITMVGQNRGRGDLRRIRRINSVHILAGVAVMLVLAVLYSLFAPLIFRAFSTSAGVVNGSVTQVRLLSFTFAGSAAAAVAAATFIGAGKPLQALAMAALRAGLISVPLAWILAGWGLTGVFAAVACGNLLALPLALIWSRISLRRIDVRRDPASGHA